MFESGKLKNDQAYKWHYFVPNLLKNGDVVIDIGANLGYFSGIFADATAPDGKVFSVEPIAPFRKQLSKLLKKYKNIEIIPFALGDENKKNVVLGVPQKFRDTGYLRHGLTTLLHGGKDVADGKFSFDAELKKANEVFQDFEKMDYIKCDIEGYETVVFGNLKELLIRHKPLVQLETWGEQLPVMLAFFKDLEFEAFKLVGDKLVPLSDIPEEKWADSDCLFVPGERKERILAFL